MQRVQPSPIEPSIYPTFPTQMLPRNPTGTTADINMLYLLKDRVADYARGGLYSQAHHIVDQALNLKVPLAIYFQWHSYVYEKEGLIGSALKCTEISLALRPDNVVAQNDKNRLTAFLHQ